MVQAIQKWLAQSRQFDSVAFLHACIVSKLSTTNSYASVTSITKDKILREVTELMTKLDLQKLIVIAPECNGELGTIVETFQHHGVQTWNCGVDFIGLATDKWLLSQELARLKIPHPKTLLLGNFMEDQQNLSNWNKVVIKPRDGAGCMDLVQFANIEIALEYVKRHQSHFHDYDKWIVQQWIDGTHASRSIIVAHGDVTWFPRMTQEFEFKESMDLGCVTLSYRGAKELQSLERSCSTDAIGTIIDEYGDALQGWIGFDFVVPDANSEHDSPVLIEINPRFTTSFAYIEGSCMKLTENWFAK